MNQIRRPAVAGQFYEANKDSLIDTIENCFLDKRGPGKIPEEKKGNKKVYGVVVPHAGFVFSGSIAAYSFKEIIENGFADSFIILGPNHTGIGSPLALNSNGSWLTPFGEAEIDNDLAEKLNKEIIKDDKTAHMHEHSIEVQLPFLQYLSDKKIKFVPISLGIQDKNTSIKVGKIIADAIKKTDKRIVIIASSDFSHVGFNYMTMPSEGIRVDEFAKMQDQKAIEKILDLDPEGLIEIVKKENISMCGAGPIAAMITASKILGAENAELLKYGTSYEVHPGSSCVGYGAISIY